MPYPKAVRDYDAVELVGRKLLDRNWALTASYVWSRLYGNYSGLSQSDENGRTDPNIGSDLRRPARAVRAATAKPLYGRLATDRPHQAKAQFVYTAPFGLNVGVFQSVASGLPVSRFAVLAPGIAPVFYAGRGSDGRTPTLSQTDVSVQYVLALGGQQAPDRRAQRAQPLQPGPGRVAVQPRNRPGRPGPSSMRPTTMPDGRM